MRNADVVSDFLKGINSKTENLYSEGRVLYSYGTHFPLGILFSDGKVAINSDRYSNTTSHHRGLLVRSVSSNDIVWLDTDDMKKVIDEGITTEKELLIKLRL